MKKIKLIKKILLITNISLLLYCQPDSQEEQSKIQQQTTNTETTEEEKIDKPEREEKHKSPEHATKSQNKKFTKTKPKNLSEEPTHLTPEQKEEEKLEKEEEQDLQDIEPMTPEEEKNQCTEEEIKERRNMLKSATQATSKLKEEIQKAKTQKVTGDHKAQGEGGNQYQKHKAGSGIELLLGGIATVKLGAVVTLAVHSIIMKLLLKARAAMFHPDLYGKIDGIFKEVDEDLKVVLGKEKVKQIELFSQNNFSKLQEYYTQLLEYKELYEELEKLDKSKLKDNDNREELKNYYEKSKQKIDNYNKMNIDFLEDMTTDDEAFKKLNEKLSKLESIESIIKTSSNQYSSQILSKLKTDFKKFKTMFSYLNLKFDDLENTIKNLQKDEHKKIIQIYIKLHQAKHKITQNEYEKVLIKIKNLYNHERSHHLVHMEKTKRFLSYLSNLKPSQREYTKIKKLNHNHKKIRKLKAYRKTYSTKYRQISKVFSFIYRKGGTILNTINDHCKGYIKGALQFINHHDFHIFKSLFKLHGDIASFFIENIFIEIKEYLLSKLKKYRESKDPFENIIKFCKKIKPQIEASEQKVKDMELSSKSALAGSITSWPPYPSTQQITGWGMILYSFVWNYPFLFQSTVLGSDSPIPFITNFLSILGNAVVKFSKEYSPHIKLFDDTQYNIRVGDFNPVINAEDPENPTIDDIISNFKTFYKDRFDPYVYDTLLDFLQNLKGAEVENVTFSNQSNKSQIILDGERGINSALKYDTYLGLTPENGKPTYKQQILAFMFNYAPFIAQVVDIMGKTNPGKAGNTLSSLLAGTLYPISSTNTETYDSFPVTPVVLGNGGFDISNQWDNTGQQNFNPTYQDILNANIYNGFYYIYGSDYIKNPTIPIIAPDKTFVNYAGNSLFNW